ncbi:MAG: MBL fold metallo-hydrolase [Nitrososphaerales archaeon]
MSDYITLYGGVGKIGGNIILLEANEERILLDFGKDFEQYAKYFEYPFNLPTTSLEKELIKTNIVPKIKSHSGEELRILANFEDNKILDEGDVDLNGVFISHAHYDHCGLYSLLKSSAKVYMGKMSKLIINCLQSTKREISIEDKMFWIKNEEKKEPRIKLSLFSNKERINLGKFNVFPMGVDHSIPGTYAFILNTGNSTLAYTADFRIHGTAKNLTKEFIEFAEEQEVDALICEGTNLGMGRVESEKDVMREIEEILDKHYSLRNRLVIAEVRSTDLDRVGILYDIARSKDLEILISTKLAYLINEIRKEGLDRRLMSSLPDLNRIKILSKKEKPDIWERELIQKYETVNSKDLENPKKPTLLIDNSRVDPFELKLPKLTLYILSISEHTFEEEQFDQERFLNSLLLNGIIVYRVHSSGHVYPLELFEMVKKIGPKKLIPIHTEHPHTFKELFEDVTEVIIPEKGKSIRIA